MTKTKQPARGVGHRRQKVASAWVIEQRGDAVFCALLGTSSVRERRARESQIIVLEALTRVAHASPRDVDVTLFSRSGERCACGFLVRGVDISLVREYAGRG